MVENSLSGSGEGSGRKGRAYSTGAEVGVGGVTDREEVWRHGWGIPSSGVEWLPGLLTEKSEAEHRRLGTLDQKRRIELFLEVGGVDSVVGSGLPFDAPLGEDVAGAVVDAQSQLAEAWVRRGGQ